MPVNSNYFKPVLKESTMILKEDLRKTHYNWTMARNHSIQHNEPDRRVFDRFNGAQVLFLINHFGKSLGRLTITDSLKIEDLISTHLPQELKSEISVFNWLRDVYLYHSN
jgi:hypothetical protein